MPVGNYKDLGFFDCNVFIGQPAAKGTLNGPITRERLLAEMDKVGVERALVAHVQAVEYHPKEGNAMLPTDLARDPRLVPCWVVLPHHTGEMPEPAELVAQMLSAGVRSARIFPGVSGGWGHRFTLHKYVVDELFRALEQHRIPLFIDFMPFRRDDPPWREIAHLCETYPNLPLILIRPGGRSDRDIYPLLDAFPNFYLETGGYIVNRGIEMVAELFGPERLIYGSGFPYYTLTGAAFRVAHTPIPESTRRLIAGGNLQRLLENVRTESKA